MQDTTKCPQCRAKGRTQSVAVLPLQIGQMVKMVCPGCGIKWLRVQTADTAAGRLFREHYRQALLKAGIPTHRNHS